MKGQEHRQTGFSLIEVIIILAVLVTLIALLVPSTVQQLTAGRRNSTLDEMDELKLAMIGDPDLKSQGVRSDFGFFGDMGNLPVGSLPSDLDELVVQGAQPAYAFNSSLRVGAGWKGPYITLEAGSDTASHRKDAFGNDYTYDDADYTNGQGQAVDGKLVSLGADGVAGGTGVDEDVTVEVLKADTAATVNGFVFDGGGAPMNSLQVAINYPAIGTLTSSTATTDATGFYQFTNIPFGIRSVTIPPRLTLVAGSVSARGGNDQHVRFRVENSSSSAITVHSLAATYTPATAPDAFYDQIRWNGNTRYNCPGDGPAGASGSTLILSTDETVAAASGGSATVVAVSSSVTQAPDITVGGGTQATIELRTFRNSATPCPSNGDVDMRGANFTDVTLRDPSNVIVGQFSFSVP